MPVEIPKEMADRLRLSIKRYVLEHWDQEIGDLKAKMFLDFVLREIGPGIYNKAVFDAQAVMSEMVAELGSTCFEPEPPHE